MRTRRLLGALGVVLVTGLGLGVRAASAEPQLDGGSTQPAPESQQAASPQRLELVFTEALSGAPTVILQKTDANNLPIKLGPVKRGEDATRWQAAIPTPLAAGVYRVSISGTAKSSYSFTVLTGPSTTSTAPSGTAGPTLTTTPSGGGTGGGTGGGSTGGGGSTAGKPNTGTAKAVGTIGRFMSYIGLAALMGGLLLIVLTWQEGVEYVLTIRFFRSAWVVALVGVVLNVVSASALYHGESVGSSLSPSGWFDLKSTTPGLAILARLAFTVACAWVAFTPERAVDAASQIPALAFPVLAVGTYGFTRSGGSIAALGILAGIAHALAYAAWFGGLVLLARVTLAGPGEGDLVQAVRGFSRIAAPALLTVVATGAIEIVRLIGGPGKLVSTNYGRLLLLKTLAVCAMAYMGTVNRHTVRARMSRADHLTDRAAFRLRRAIGSEALAGVVTLGLTALMIGSVPPGLTGTTTTGGEKPAVIAVFKQGSLDATVGVGPAKAGPNSITISVRKPTTDLVDLTVELYPVNGQASGIKIPVTASQVSGGKSYVVNGVPLGTAGQWTVIVSGTVTGGKIAPVSQGIVIAAAEGTVVTTPGSTRPASTAPAAATTLAPATTGAGG